MFPDTDPVLVVIGAAAGLLPDAIRFAKNRHKGFPDWFRKGGYWLGLLVLVALGALAAWLGEPDDWRAALAFGYAAPEVLSRSAAEPSAQTRDATAFPLRRWWSR